MASINISQLISEQDGTAVPAAKEYKPMSVLNQGARQLPLKQLGRVARTYREQENIVTHALAGFKVFITSDR